MTRRGGFTLIEMLTVVLIIAALATMLLPAIQGTREAARRTQCQNSLLQIGLALGNYASTHGVLPPGVVERRGPISNRPVGNHIGWAVQILPFLEQGNLHRRIDVRLGAYAPTNATATGTTVKVFLCPSNPSAGRMDYVGCHHDVEAPIDADNHGVLYLNSHVAYDDIADGPAYTILVGEARQMSVGWASGTRASLRNAGHSINAPDPLDDASAVIPSSGPQPPGQPEPNFFEAMVRTGQLPASYVGGFSSWHSGGANALLCDGSVRFLKETIDRDVLGRLGHRADGELIGDDQF
jgi:prepilin-type N-terminal cleavage/methylation domain-containing protein/prepilin-type processing-associated H-X9-DG protein